MTIWPKATNHYSSDFVLVSYTHICPMNQQAWNVSCICFNTYFMRDQMKLSHHVSLCLWKFIVWGLFQLKIYDILSYSLYVISKTTECVTCILLFKHPITFHGAEGSHLSLLQIIINFIFVLWSSWFLIAGVCFCIRLS